MVLLVDRTAQCSVRCMLSSACFLHNSLAQCTTCSVHTRSVCMRRAEIHAHTSSGRQLQSFCWDSRGLWTKCVRPLLAHALASCRHSVWVFVSIMWISKCHSWLCWKMTCFHADSGTPTGIWRVDSQWEKLCFLLQQQFRSASHPQGVAHTEVQDA